MTSPWTETLFYSKCGNIFWETGARPSSRVSETWRMSMKLFWTLVVEQHFTKTLNVLFLDVLLLNCCFLEFCTLPGIGVGSLNVTFSHLLSLFVCLCTCRYLSDLHAPGDPAWQCIYAQHKWILQLMQNCRDEFIGGQRGD